MARPLTSGVKQRPVGLYVHVPFCASRCAYCTFVTSTQLDRSAQTLAATATEIRSWPGRLRRPMATAYIGGGTPSLIPIEHLGELFGAIRSRFEPLADAEVTLEANPDDVTPERIRGWRELGVNRVSLGVQAFQDRILAYLGRRHDARQAMGAATDVIGAGLSLSIDLMLGLPGLGRGELEETVAEVLRLRPHHISVYLLETDKPHQLGRLAERRPDLFPDTDAAASQYLAVGRGLVGGGYHHYEISNFCLPGHAARHNTSYWLRRPVLAAGLAAHGGSGRRRWANCEDLDEYLARVAQARSPIAWSRRLSPDEVRRETVMLALRLAAGVADRDLVPVQRASREFAETLASFLALGLARRVGERTRLTPRGWLVSNELLTTLW